MFHIWNIVCKFATSLLNKNKEQKPRFKLILSKEAKAFLHTLSMPVRRKIAYNIDKVAYGKIDNTLFKKLDNTDIWEFRTLYEGVAYRVLAFWDTDNETLVIATNGFVKKSQKTPQKEIAKAEEIRKRYFKERR